MFGLSITDVRKFAFETVERNQLKHRFNKNEKTDGKKRLCSFMKRNPTLSLRQPEGISMLRVKVFNQENVSGSFDILEKVVDKKKTLTHSEYSMLMNPVSPQFRNEQ
jgi:hypothetical protein